MDIHKNARLTLISRELLAQQVISRRLTLKAAAAAFNVSVKTAHKWVIRYQQLGRTGLQDRSSRPHNSPRRTGASLIERVRTLRLQRRTGLHISQATDLSPATVSRILRRLGLHRWQALDPAQPPVQRYEYPTPGGLLHFDIKALGRFTTPSRSLHRPGKRRSQHAGWEYLHVVIDDHSRIAFVQLFPDQSQASAIAFLNAALAFYARLSIPPLRIMTDNGGCYRGWLFRRHVQQLNLTHIFTRPYTPRTNGKAERFIQTALREWARAHAYQSSLQRANHLSCWLTHYNFYRPHASLKKAPPISRCPGQNRNNLLIHHSELRLYG